MTREAGIILPMVIILGLTVTITGLAYLTTVVHEHKLVNHRINTVKAFYLADAGIERMAARLKAGVELRSIDWTGLGEGTFKVEWYAPWATSTGQIIDNRGRSHKRSIKVKVMDGKMLEWQEVGLK